MAAEIHDRIMKFPEQYNTQVCFVCLTYNQVLFKYQSYSL